MFKLEASLEEAESLAKSEPERYELGVGNWVTTRFSAEDPLPKKIWSSWLKESYGGATKSGRARKKSARQKEGVVAAVERRRSQGLQRSNNIVMITVSFRKE